MPPLERVVNTPTRGTRPHAGRGAPDLARSPANIAAGVPNCYRKSPAGRAASALQRFMELIDAPRRKTADMPLHVQTDRDQRFRPAHV